MVTLELFYDLEAFFAFVGSELLLDRIIRYLFGDSATVAVTVWTTLRGKVAKKPLADHL